MVLYTVLDIIVRRPEAQYPRSLVKAEARNMRQSSGVSSNLNAVLTPLKFVISAAAETHHDTTVPG